MTSKPRATRKPAAAPTEAPANPTPQEATAVPTPAPAPAPTAKPAPANCGCGCGQPTVTAKARFLSGHDARWAGALGRGEVPQPLTAQQASLLTPRLQAKVDGIRATTAKRAAEKAAKAAAKAAAAKAYADALAN